MNFMAIIIVLFMLGLLALIVIALISLYKWASSDARERGMQSPVMWGLIVLLVPNLIGLIIYLVVRENHKITFPCPQCGRSVPQFAGYCPACGAGQAAPAIQSTVGTTMPSRHLKRFGICLGSMLLLAVLFMVGMVIYNVNSAMQYESSAAIFPGDLGVGVLENNTSHSQDKTFMYWSGNESRSATTREIAIDSKLESGELHITVTDEDGNLYEAVTGEHNVITLEREQQVTISVKGDDARNGSFHISWE